MPDDITKDVKRILEEEANVPFSEIREGLVEHARNVEAQRVPEQLRLQNQEPKRPAPEVVVEEVKQVMETSIGTQLGGNAGPGNQGGGSGGSLLAVVNVEGVLYYATIGGVLGSELT